MEKNPTSVTKTWFVPTSPRSPHKLRNELKLLSKFDGREWWEKDKSGNLKHQIKFAQKLKESNFFEGTISKDHPALSARDRCRAFFTYGFAFVGKKGKLRITDAGRRLIRGERVEDLFLKQLLKWQYPSWQHGGNPRTRYKYDVKNMDVFPFVEALRVLKEIKYLSKREIAIFLLPTLTRKKFQKVPEDVQEFREKIQNEKAGLPRREFIKSYHKERFEGVYRKNIKKGEFKTREIPTKTKDDFLNKKVRNSKDYADAATRYFQYTGLVTRTIRGIEITPFRKNEAEEILEEMDFNVKDYYDDVNKFYSYLGNPSLPKLPWEKTEILKRKAKELEDSIDEIIQKVQVIDSSFYPKEKPKMPSLETIEELEDFHYKLRSFRRRMKKELLIRELQQPDKVKEIITMYEKIVNREVTDPSLFLEWNTWRAFLALNYCSTKPNFKMDDDLMPLFPAGGREPDLEVYFNDDYVVLVEVTLSSGARQYNTESEPVTRHIGNFQEEEKKRDGRKVWGIFVAPEINPSASSYFYVHLSHVKITEDAGYMTIIPVPLEEFIDFLEFCTKYECFSESAFKGFLKKIESQKDTVKNGEEWREAVSGAIHKWKKKHSP